MRRTSRPSPKLTVKQLECLRELAKPGSRASVCLPRFEWGGGWWVSSNHRMYTRQVGKLLGYGLLTRDRRKTEYHIPDARINAKGRKALKEASRA